MKHLLLIFLMFIIFLSGCTVSEYDNPITFTSEIVLNDKQILVDNKKISTDSDSNVYADNNIIYYKENQDFTYGAGKPEDEHSEAEANKHTVVHISKAGTYSISGNLSFGQIAIDLGAEAINNPDAIVTLFLNNVTINCDIAPAIIFYNVYECGNDNEEEASYSVNTQNAGANIIIADNSKNEVYGSYVARIYKNYTLSSDGKEVIENKKLHKYDGAIHSKMSLNIKGENKCNGFLNINAKNEGIATEMHLTIYSGNIKINSMDDGINANEDNISVISLYKPDLTINVNGYYGEGDGIDSNGWIIIYSECKLKIETKAPIIDDCALDAHFGVHYYKDKINF